ncbi:MAG TPA: alkene reductase [Chromatiales bacterium]|nr:alkene reductase [Chromatiales bacterium]
MPGPQAADIDLFTPIQLGPYSLPNRIVMAPMTRNRAGPGNVPTPLTVEYYVQRASAGLIITEGSPVSPQAVGYPATPGIHTEEQVAGWRQVTDAVHDAGGRIFIQLWHTGRVAHPDLQPGGALPVAPSALPAAGEAMTFEGPKPHVLPRALETGEIPDIIEQFRTAARNAQAAGFDGAEIHGANGYLLDQFLRDGSNQRTDEYGGPVENRARLLLEVTAAVAEVWDASRVGVRLSPLQPFNGMRDSDPRATFGHVVERLNEQELAYLHITEMGQDSPGTAGPAFDLSVLRQIYRGTCMINGGYHRDSANAALQAGRADLVSFGVLFLANPDLPARFAKGAPLTTPDEATFYGGDATGYTDYPAWDEKRATENDGMQRKW